MRSPRTTTCWAAMDRVRALGVTLAVDDAGACYASMRHIVELRAQHVPKLDRALVADLEGRSGPAGHGLGRGCTITRCALGCQLLAEGIETDAERDHAPRPDGLRLGQGYYYARPTTLEAALAI